MNDRSLSAILGQFRHLPLNVPRLVQQADERNRTAGDQCELHVRPVFPGRVIDDRPAFERRLRALIENQTVAGFPHRRGNHITRRELPRLVVRGVDVDAPLFLGTGIHQRRQVVLELQLQLRIGKPDSGHGRQIHVAKLSRIEQQRDLLLLLALVVARNQPPADDRAGDSLSSRLQLHASALKLIEDRAERLLRAQLKRKLAQPLLQRLTRVVAQTGDLAAALLFDRERLEHVVHLRRFEIEASGLTRSELSGAFEIADTMLVEHNLLDRQVRRERRRSGHESGNGPHHIHELDTTGDGASHFEGRPILALGCVEQRLIGLQK